MSSKSSQSPICSSGRLAVRVMQSIESQVGPHTLDSYDMSPSCSRQGEQTRGMVRGRSVRVEERRRSVGTWYSGLTSSSSSMMRPFMPSTLGKACITTQTVTRQGSAAWTQNSCQCVWLSSYLGVVEEQAVEGAVHAVVDVVHDGLGLRHLHRLRQPAGRAVQPTRHQNQRLSDRVYMM